MSQPIKQHKMVYTTGVARTAAADITHFLETHWKQTVTVHNVEDDKAYQQYDIDLLWTVVTRSGRLRVIPIEVKGDRYHYTGNFFFETVSNETKGTPGCFLYTKAAWLFYYFVETGALYCLPMDKVRPWFVASGSRFEEKRTSTPVGGATYVTIGRLVPIETVLAEVKGIMHFQKEGSTWLQKVFPD